MFLYVFLEEDCNGKKRSLCRVGCNNNRLFPEKCTVKKKARVHTDRGPPRHPIILLKSNNFNMAAVSVKRSICSDFDEFCKRRFKGHSTSLGEH